MGDRQSRWKRAALIQARSLTGLLARSAVTSALQGGLGQNAYIFWHIPYFDLAEYIRLVIAIFYQIQIWEHMLELAWTDQLSVGNATIDSEHKALLNMVRDIVLAIRAGENIALIEAFKTLEDWLHAHFANERKIAQAINFPFTRQQQAQQYSLKELQLLKDELIAKEGSWSESAAEHYANFLGNWIVDEHIVKTDMPMKPTLQKYPYNFLPA